MSATAVVVVVAVAVVGLALLLADGLLGFSPQRDREFPDHRLDALRREPVQGEHGVFWRWFWQCSCASYGWTKTEERAREKHGEHRVRHVEPAGVA